jgi:hypothetical protein
MLRLRRLVGEDDAVPESDLSDPPSQQPVGVQSEPSRKPRSKRFLWIAGPLVLLVGVLVYFAARGGSGELNLGTVAEAAERTGAEPGGSVEMEVTYSVAGESKSTTATGAGVFDNHSGRARLELSVPEADGTPLKVESVGDEKTTFVGSRVLSEQLPPGKRWLGMEPLLGHDPTTALSAGGGAKGSLEMLRAVGGDVERVGDEAVRGENATLYKGTVDLLQAAQKFTAKGQTGLARLLSRSRAVFPARSRSKSGSASEAWSGVSGCSSGCRPKVARPSKCT